MTLKERILKEEFKFPKLFADFEEREWGIMFFKENNKGSHDSNHAILYPEKIADFEKTILEIKDFYFARGLSAQIYQPSVDGYFAEREEIFARNGFEVKVWGRNRVMLLDAENIIPPSRKLSIRRISQWDEALSQLYRQAGEEHGIEADKESLKSGDFFLFAGYVADEPVVTVSFHVSEYDCTRFDYVFTALKHRGQGYARELLSYVTDFCREKNFQNCFQWPANQTSESICYQAGFRTAFEFEGATAFSQFS